MKAHSWLTIVAFTAVILCVASARARADTILWIDDVNGNVGQVDLTTHTVSGVVNTNQSLTDIGFNSSGTLYGTSFSGLYSINTSTGATTSLGTYGTVGGGGMNALVGSGGTNLLAASNSTNDVYSVNPASAGTASIYGTSPLVSAGDLAFSGSTLYESGVNSSGQDSLVNVSTDQVVGTFTSGTTSSFAGVFGLADDGTAMYAVNGTEIFSVNLSNADLTPLFNYSGQGLAAANGTAFIGEGSSSVPEPSSLAILGAALVGLVCVRRRRSA